MAVTKQTYTAAPTWTASSVAGLFEDAFTDAGLMTAWYDSFDNGVFEHRILEVQYNSAKTYGKCYYWFIFQTTGVYVAVASGWNASTHVPTGTQYLDFYSTATNTNVNHFHLSGTVSTSTSLELVRYTSDVDSDYSWFVLRNGVTPFPFFIAPASTTLAPWLDLDKVLFHHLIRAFPVTTSANGITPSYLTMLDTYMLRRSYISQGALRESTFNQYFARVHPAVMVYYGLCNGNNNPNNFAQMWPNPSPISSGPYPFGVSVPYGFNNVNPEYATNFTPVINGYTYSVYSRDSMPVDFAIAFAYGTTSYSFGDKIIVNAGVEEWEICGFANNINADAASSLLLSRVV